MIRDCRGRQCRGRTRRASDWGDSAADDHGSMLPLIAGFGTLALVIVLVVSAATSLYLERKRLFSLADGAALAGAESFELADVRLIDGVLRAELDPEAVNASVADYLREAPSGRFEQLVVERATTTDGTSATVSLSSAWSPPVVTLFVPDGIRLEVTATARSVFG